MMQSRTHNCGELRAQHAGEHVKLVGWMENVREVGGSLAFVVLRDFYGTTQIVVETSELLAQIKGYNKESTISVEGTVRERASKNPNQPTGDIEVVPEKIEQISRRRHTMCQYFTVDDLAYLERGGRVSKAAAIVGTVLKIKPLLRGDDEGKIVQCGKTRGRKQSLTALADFYEKLVADKSEEIGIAHADDAAGAQFLLDALRQRGFTGECLTVCYEPVTGSHVGPGTVALFFQGIHR